MEVRHQLIDKAELVAGIDEDIRPVATGSQRAVSACGFQRAYCRRADSNYTSALGLRLINSVSSLLRNGVELLMHLVVLDIRLAYRAEGSQTNVQSYENLLAAQLLDFRQQLLREVQACGRCSSAATLTVINCLIALLILQRCRNIRRQRRFAKTVENLFKNAFILKADNTAAEVSVLDNLAAQLVAEVNPCAHLQLLAGTHEHLPVRRISARQQENLYVRTRILRAVQTRRNNARIVEHQHIAGTQIIHKVIEMLVLKLARVLINNQQTRMVTRLHRMLSNQLLRQLIIKICY